MTENESSAGHRSIRGLAILLMIMVHSAATWAPSNASTTSLFAIVVASLGGLAAPLFVTVGGWVTVQSTWTIRKALIRFVFLMMAQFLVNITASHRFDLHTRRFLIVCYLYLLAPIWIRIARNSIAFGATLVLIGIINTVFSKETPLYHGMTESRSLELIRSFLIFW